MTYVNIAQELENLIVNDIAKRIFIDISTDLTNYYKLKSQAVMFIFKNNYSRFFKESIS